MKIIKSNLENEKAKLAASILDKVQSLECDKLNQVQISNSMIQLLANFAGKDSDHFELADYNQPFEKNKDLNIEQQPLCVKGYGEESAGRPKVIEQAAVAIQGSVFTVDMKVEGTYSGSVVDCDKDVIKSLQQIDCSLSNLLG